MLINIVFVAQVTSISVLLVVGAAVIKIWAIRMAHAKAAAKVSIRVQSAAYTKKQQ